MLESNISRRISIQISLSGYSFNIYGEGATGSEGWTGTEHFFTSEAMQQRYDAVDIALMTPKFILVPDQFFDPSQARQALADMIRLSDTDVVEYIPIPQYSATLIYSNSIGESLSRAVAAQVLNTAGEQSRILPEMWYMLEMMGHSSEYNKIFAAYADGYLHLAIAQGNNLQLCNSFKAADFTTAEYFIFLSLKKLQLNPEVSSICFTTPLAEKEEMSLYRYFRAVEKL